ncbi:hypothetical protein EON65_50010 [archaeon]|nr:MAG: hypothetical protein EON65_50010 [archaeon]
MVKDFAICEDWLGSKTYDSGRNLHMKAACNLYWNLKQIINEHRGPGKPDKSGEDEGEEGQDLDTDSDGDHAETDDSGYLDDSILSNI